MENQLLLVVEDQDCRASLTRLMSTAGYTVRSAATAEESLGQLAGVGVVLSDHLIPEMGGIELLRHVRAQRPQATRYLMTESQGRNGLADAVAGGLVSAVLKKPWNEQALLTTVACGFHMYAVRSILPRESNQLDQGAIPASSCGI